MDIKWTLDMQFDGGVTSPVVPGKTKPDWTNNTIIIHIHITALYDAKNLYMTIGHELIHARDFDNGNWLEWTYKYEPNQVRNIMENHAYMWDVETEKQLGKYNHAADNYEYTKQLLPAGFKFEYYKN